MIQKLSLLDYMGPDLEKIVDKLVGKHPDASIETTMERKGVNFGGGNYQLDVPVILVNYELKAPIDLHFLTDDQNAFFTFIWENREESPIPFSDFGLFYDDSPPPSKLQCRVKARVTHLNTKLLKHTTYELKSDGRGVYLFEHPVHDHEIVYSKGSGFRINPTRD